MQIPLDQLIPALATALAGVFAFLVRHYFASFRKDISGVQKDFAKIEGHLTALQHEIRSNTIELAKTTSELRAIWRFVDNAPKRASDKNGDHP